MTCLKIDIAEERRKNFMIRKDNKKREKREIGSNIHVLSNLCQLYNTVLRNYIEWEFIFN